MRYLLDTHVWLWAISTPKRLTAPVREALADPGTPVFLSAASTWEIAIKYHLGKLQLPDHPRDFVPPRLVRDAISPLVVQHAHAAEVAGLPDHHNDPFDRLLVAQARIERMVLVTADEAMRPYEVDVLWAE